jgi:hypothetical protein
MLSGHARIATADVASESAKLIFNCSDINIHDMSGIELLPRLRECPARCAGDHDHRLMAMPKRAESDRGGRRGPVHQADRPSAITQRDQACAPRRIAHDGESPRRRRRADLEGLVRQKFRRQIKDGSIAFGLARQSYHHAG